MARSWTPDQILQVAGSFQPACVLAAAADLELFEAVGDAPFTSEQAAGQLGCDARGMSVLLDALAALELLEKAGAEYRAAPGVGEALGKPGAGRNVLAMAQHQANCLRRWSQLARSVKTGRPAERIPSIRGADADYAAFIEAMDNVSRPMAGSLVGGFDAGAFRHLLDVGGASGTWTIAFMRKYPGTRATIFDLPQVRAQAEERIAAEGLSDRVAFVAGDYFVDPLPRGADLAWVSAIVHQNSREQNRTLYRRVLEALEPGGRILIRDIYMEENRVRPARGALFAVNMLSATAGGGTYTVGEMVQDLNASGFRDAALLHKGTEMDSVMVARKG